MELLTSASFDALGIGSMEEPGFLREAGIELPMYFDQGMYSWNHLAGAAMERYRADRLTIPVELNEREIRDSWCSGRDDRIRVSSDDDLRPVYQKNNAWMFRKVGNHVVKGPQGHAVPGGKTSVVSVTIRSTILRRFPLLGLSEQVTGLKPNAVRLNFTVEEPAAAGEIPGRVL